ncbi:MAG: Eco57I restriction-modification methylase domain-containing protein [Bacteroidales bacterium]|nr:Eco57I restriction-modification methylase domain-containing protein [Candidatus Physcocola equi]
MAINTENLDKVIYGRIEPQIYTFSTKLIPDYLKIGDTYRPVEVRLNEWKKHYSDLVNDFQCSASVDNNVYFRDYSIHNYLLENGKQRLTESNLKSGLYFSNEFFAATTNCDVCGAISDIKTDYKSNGGKYSFYRAGTVQSYTYVRSMSEWEPRPNQKSAIDKFKEAINKGRTNLLMYAVMRFGKSFTSLCCAKEMDAKFVVVVSAKADVKDEWKYNVEVPQNFADYEFVESKDLQRDPQKISKIRASGKNVVVFLTLQDLASKDVKKKHKELFEKKGIDLLIIDETHFAARAEHYGAVLAGAKVPLDSDDDSEDEVVAKESMKILDAKVRLHLSGTPYRILMSSEFKAEDIVSFCQFSDIMEEQEKWNIDNPEDDEWNNPYYGFPQMVRFALCPNKDVHDRLNDLRKNGVSYAFSQLLRPVSLKKDTNNLHKKFIYEDEILKMFQIIDGSKKDDTLFSFLDYQKLKDGKMCQHIVCVLPFCASCDALEELLISHKDDFKNLKEYRIINISGLDSKKKYSKTKNVKSEIDYCEANGRKTITLTVNRMLTGSTVRQWDTMLFMKDTASPQEYDQAIFRLQNQNVKSFVDEKGKVIKYNMKPQTLLVDFAPNRMFVLQAQKSLINNVNEGKSGGNNDLNERLKNELKISPIFRLNSDKMVEVIPEDVITAVSEYSNSRSAIDEANDIAVDVSLMKIKSLLEVIKSLPKIGSHEGIIVPANKAKDESKKANALDVEEISSSVSTSGPSEKEKPSEEKDFAEHFRTLYVRILFFAFLTKSKVNSVDEIIRLLEKEDEKENKRIAGNLQIYLNLLKVVRKFINPFILNELDNKIFNLNTLANDTKVDPLQRAQVCINKFQKISISEIITPPNLADDVVALLPDDAFDGRILDIASKVGEFTIALYNRMTQLNKDKENIRKNIYALPTSSVAYEFTLKIFEILHLNIDNIFDFTSYDLIKNEEKKQKIRIMKFNAIVGNPPYQELDGGGTGAAATPIYNLFVDVAKTIAPSYFSMIMPARWYNGGRGLDDFRRNMLDETHICKLFDYPNPKECFPNTNISGGVCFFLWDKNYDSNECEFVNVTNGKKNPLKRSWREFSMFIRYNDALSIVRKVKNVTPNSLAQEVSDYMPFGIRSYERGTNTKSNSSDLLLYSSAGVGYFDRTLVSKGVDYIDKYKVITGKAISGHLGEGDANGQVKILSTTKIINPNEITTESYLVIGRYDNVKEADNLLKYMRTKFLRFLLLQGLTSMNITKDKFEFVPLQDFTSSSDINWSLSIPEIDQQLYKKYGLSDDEIAFIEKMIKPM